LDLESQAFSCVSVLSMRGRQNFEVTGGRALTSNDWISFMRIYPDMPLNMDNMPDRQCINIRVMHEDNLNEAKFARYRTAPAVSAFTDTELQYRMRPDLEFRQGQILQTLGAAVRRICDKTGGDATTIGRT
jgi:hypothetical protein